MKTPVGKPLYITGGTLVDPARKLHAKGEILLVQGRVAALGKPGELKAKAQSSKAETIDAGERIVAPGFIDLNCRIPDPGGEQKETFASGSAAAAAGGFTALACMPSTAPFHDNAFMTDFIQRRAREHSLVRVLPVGAISHAGEGKRLAEIGSMVQAGARALSDDGRTVMDTYLMRKALDYAKAFGVPIFSYAEDQYLHGQAVMHEGVDSNRLGLRGVPAAAEEIIVARDLVLARHTGGKLHFSSVSTKGALELIRRAKAEGLNITAETHPAYFHFSAEHIASYDANFKVFPPLRTESDIEAVVAALADGTLDAVASGHTPQLSAAKNQVFEHAAAGMIGLETVLPMLGKFVARKTISVSRLVELLSTNPAKILGFKGELGTLAPGAAADVTIIDPGLKYTYTEAKVQSASRNTPLLGMKLQGAVDYCIVNGTVVSRGLR